MSFNNHDSGDINGKKYGATPINSLSKEEETKGKAIKIYLEANNKPLKDFIEWFSKTYNN